MKSLNPNDEETHPADVVAENASHLVKRRQEVLHERIQSSTEDSL